MSDQARITETPTGIDVVLPGALSPSKDLTIHLDPEALTFAQWLVGAWNSRNDTTGSGFEPSGISG